MNTGSNAELVLGSCPTPGAILRFLSQLAQEDGKFRRFSAFSAAIYDTAWLSMIHKKEHDQVSWLFPECFDYLLDCQKEDGTWATFASQVDGILNTLAALLSLATRIKLGALEPNRGISLSWRIEKAQSGLQSLLKTWDVDETVHVGFEILVPSLLRQVGLFGIRFEFPGHHRLIQLYNRKLEKFKPAMLYSKQQTTLLHSLEAFVGLIDFDSVSHHCNEEVGIFGSPAATAAYLLNGTKWDTRADTYLRNTVSARGNSGGVPSAFPTSVFELSWALSTLLSHHLAFEDLKAQDAVIISSFLAETLEKQNGLVGFAPGILEDADDTARTLIALYRLGKDVDPRPMIDKFQSDDHFRTYETEQYPSFSANCNVLLALLEFQSIDEYLPQIETTVTFLLKEWDGGKISDKWNLSPQYSLMLLSEALIRLLKRFDAGHLQRLPAKLIQQQLPAVLCQILSRTLNHQQEDGSWAASVEVTAYSVLTIAQCLSAPWSAGLRALLIERIWRGRSFIALEQAKPPQIQYIWVEKTTYGSPFLRMVYCSSALHISCDQHVWSQRIADCFLTSGAGDKEMRYIFSVLPLFQQSPSILLDLVLVEAAYFTKTLKDARDTIVPRDRMPIKEGKYLHFIPVIWVACNQKGGHVLSSNQLRSMLELSLFIYQIDELMESVIVHLAEPELQVLVSTIAHECGLDSDFECGDMARSTYQSPEHWPKVSDSSQKSHNRPSRQPQEGVLPLEGVVQILTKFIGYVLQHPAVLQSPRWSRKELAIEVHNFLLAHINHNLDNLRSLKRQRKPSNGYATPTLSQSSYFKWVRSVASDDTSCPFAFQFFTCLVGKPGLPCFGTPQAQYISQSLTRHLSTMCRQYNDFGSAARDAEEGNLNSLDFPEFSRGSRADVMKSCTTTVNGQVRTNGGGVLDQASLRSTDAAKDELMAIAEFERACMQLALQKLKQVMPSTTSMKAFEVYIDVTDLFGQVYVQRDLSSRQRETNQV